MKILHRAQAGLCSLGLHRWEWLSDRFRYCQGCKRLERRVYTYSAKDGTTTPTWKEVAN